MKLEKEIERTLKGFIVGGKYAGDEALLKLMGSFWMRRRKK